MPAFLYLSPSIEAALAHLLKSIRSIKSEDPFTQATLLAPSTVSMNAIRSRLGDTFNVRLYQFYGLGQSILDAANRPARRLSEVTLRRLVQTLLQEMADQGELTSFALVWQKPGFIQIMLDWLREMKTQGIIPEQVRRQSDLSGLARDRQLALLYERYQAFLVENDDSDSDGMLWLAAEALERDPNLLAGTGFFATVGFDQFNPVQLRILRALSQRCSGFSIYLPWDSSRSQDSLAYTRLIQTRQNLDASIQMQVVPLQDIPDLPASLCRLRRSIFDPGQAQDEMQAEAEPAVQLIVAPAREAEVRRALREIKKRLQAGLSPNQVALLAPNPGVYRRLVRAVAIEYGIPLLVEHSLAESPVVAALTNLLSLASDFPWRQTMDALRSPYILQSWLSADQIEQLDRLSRERPVVGGIDQWRFCLQPAPPSADAEDDDLGPPRLASLLGEAALKPIQEGLERFFTHLTPPPQAPHHVYTLWIQEALLGLSEDPEGDDPDENSIDRSPSLNILKRCRENEDLNSSSRRDLEALGIVLQCLRSLLESAELVLAEEQKIVSWEVFRGDLLRLLASASIPPGSDRPGLRFLALEEGRALPLQDLYILGLAEGEFPAAPPPDPLYSTAERVKETLPLERREPGEAASLWWQVLTAPNRSLTLLRPYLDENGAPWLASPYYNAVQAALPGIQEEKIKIAEIPSVEDCASPAELLVAMAAGNASTVPPELGQPWKTASEAQRILAARQSWRDIPDYEGFIQAPDLLAELEKRYFPDYPWSATAINRFAKCPYIFFSERVLKVKKLPDPEAGLDDMQRGSLLHAILEDLFRGLAADGIAPSASSREIVLERLEQSCQAIFEKAPERFGFRPSALWRYEQDELRRMLHSSIEWECQENGDPPRFFPFRQELHFGTGRGAISPLTISSDAGTFRLNGVIDRIDRDAAGRLRVIDYKSGSSTVSEPDLKKCLAVQTALYALAVQQIFSQEGLQVEKSAFLHLPKQEFSGKIDCPQGPAEDPTVQEIAAAAYSLTRQVQQGGFPADPAKPYDFGRPCSSGCDFGPLCRVDRHTIQKARRRGFHGADNDAI